MPLEGTVRVRISDDLRQRNVILIKARVQRRESCSGVKSRSQILEVLGCKGKAADCPAPSGSVVMTHVYVLSGPG